MQQPTTAIDESAQGRDLVVSVLFTTLTDLSNSAAKIGIHHAGQVGGNPLRDLPEDRLYDYMSPWYESLHAHPGLNGLVLYDRLPPEFVERWRSAQVSFEPFHVGDPYAAETSGMIQRMVALRQFLGRRHDVSRIWFTDINDVAFVLDPFQWMDGMPFAGSWLLAGEEWTTFRNSDWWNGSAKHFGGEYVSLFSGRFADMYLINAGVWGGRRDVVASFLDRFIRQVDLLLAAGLNLGTVPGCVADMFAVNLVAYRDFFGRLATFKLEARSDRPIFEPGAFFRGANNPVIHDRPSAMKAIEELRSKTVGADVAEDGRRAQRRDAPSPPLPRAERRAGPGAPRAVVWLKNVPRELLPELRRRGFHAGFSNEQGRDDCLGRIFQQPCPREEKAAQFRTWLAAVTEEAGAHPGAVAAIWSPAAESDEDARAVIEEVCGGRLVERSGATLAEVLGRAAEQVVLGTQRIEVPHAEGFNGALLPLPEGGFLLVYRSDEPRLASCQLDADLRVVPGSGRAELKTSWSYDPRLFADGAGNVFLLAGWHDGSGGDRIELRRVVSTSSMALGPPIYFDRISGFPGYTPRREKNWGPFFHEGQSHFVYSVLPHRIVAADPARDTGGGRGWAELRHASDWALPADWPDDCGTTLMGSAPPVRLDDGSYLGTFHAHGRSDRRLGYYHGFYRFEATPPFRVIAASRRPAITPLMASGHNVQNESVREIFIQSMQIEDGLVRLCGGDNDHSVVVVHLSLAAVLGEMDEVEAPRMPVISEAAFFRRYGTDPPDIPLGTLTPTEAKALLALARSQGCRRFAEFGAGAGGNAALLLAACPEAESYVGIDARPAAAARLPSERAIAPEQAGAEAGDDPRFRIIIEPRGAQGVVPDDVGPVDFVLIGGERGAEAVRRDTRLARGLVQRGVICWHDYRPGPAIGAGLADEELYRSKRGSVRQIADTKLCFEIRGEHEPATGRDGPGRGSGAISARRAEGEAVMDILRGRTNARTDGESAVVLGQYSGAHLGDTLCTSTLPRLLAMNSRAVVYVESHPMLRAVFANNPYVAGFVEGPRERLDGIARGEGHILQRLERGLRLPVSPVPKPEIYLTQAELDWAAAERRRWPAGRPVCVLSTAAITDRGNTERVDWTAVAGVLRERFTLVQPVLDERPVPGTIPYRCLSVRQYLALLSAADAFVGGTSGGSHVAAAFDLPSLIVSWRSLLDPLRFPVGALGVKATFLYPQQWHIAAEDLSRQTFHAALLRGILDEMVLRGRECRPVDAGTRIAAPEHPPAAAFPRRMVRVGRQRARLPDALAKRAPIGRTVGAESRVLRTVPG